MHENGLGMRADPAEAAQWYRRAAAQGNAQGQANLGVLYFDGRGVTNDLAEAYMWFKLSVRQGYGYGRKFLIDYQTHSLLTPDQLGEAERRVRAFRVRLKTGGN